MPYAAAFLQNSNDDSNLEPLDINKSMKRLIPICILSLSTMASANPTPLIFDTDITGDVDDVLALAMIHTLADRGACELLAVTISKENDLVAPFTDAVNTFYGRPDIPIGINPNAPHRDSKYLELVTKKDRGQFRYPHDMGEFSEPENAISLLRKTLSAAEDRSVAIIQLASRRISLNYLAHKEVATPL